MVSNLRRILVMFLAAWLLIVNVPLSAQAILKHTVDIGETLASIAQRYGTTEARIIELNPDAADFIYVGMELVIPVASPANLTEVMENLADKKDSVAFGLETALSMSLSQTDAISQEVPERLTSSREDERKSAIFEVMYTAGSFEDVKFSGMYGFGFTMHPWEIAPDLYAGFHFSPLNFNFGLVPEGYESDVVMLGPAIGYYFTPAIFISAPLDVICNVSFGIGRDDKVYTKWGLSLSPSVYIGRKFGVFLGPVFSISFVKNAEVVCGFRAGIFF
ncbi:MAG TPA: LysM peptidoglycan-binding domain-containing protein [Candidatus Coprenecus pullicola]|nr:LysM peptidoglycan-binding domain-containing protein [Candidatus Coprenecus pullicola]